ncbi:JAB domain-containing protein [Stenotrophomonas sp.]|uniref:JAB domain-containing protein n=1 Tax=Stenotrophomonas sp. TaxID=69392 RepID=UPI0028B0F850|nr:JAB domain-containing protein [Stenotrophomonas sp.]
MGDVATCAAYFRLRLGNEPREHFDVAFLDAKFRLLVTERLFSGTIDSAQVSPRIVLQRALTVNAAAVILAHNHPSGCLEPSAADVSITACLKSTLGLVDIRLLDHFIVSNADSLSMASRGIL